MRPSANVESLLSNMNDSPRFSPDSIDSLIGAGMNIKGDIACKGTLRVQGTLNGNINCDSGPAAALVVDSAGTVTGTVHAMHLHVRGRIVGPVESAHSVEIHPGGTVFGDVSFRELAIHAGGIIEGLMLPLPPAPNTGTDERSPPQTARGRATRQSDAVPASDGRWGIDRRTALLATLAVVVVVLGWTSRDIWQPARTTESYAGKPESQTVAQPQAAPPAPASETRKDAPAEDKPPAPLAASESVTAIPPAQQSLPERSDSAQANIATVRGANPSRPANVFLLISGEASVLYKKKRDEPGEGTRIATEQGEKVSISVAPDELIRVAKGHDVTIYFQGQKVSRRILESGAWISLVPK